jgi:DNA-binding LacI/PurR family transcriptional regulator
MKKAPRYYKIKEELKELINEKRINLGENIPSECELARKYSVSRMTARRAVMELVKEGLLIRISGKGTFVSASVKNPAKPNDGSAKSIALCVYDYDYITNSYIMQMINGIHSQISQHGYRLKIGITKNKFQRLDCNSYYKNLKSHISGLIIYDDFIKDKDIEEIKGEGIPFVLINRKSNAYEANSVLFDYRYCSEKIVDRLAKAGHKNIGLCIADTKSTSSIDIIVGYKIALKKYNLNNCLIAEHGSLGTHHAVEKWVEANNFPTAIIGNNDLVAVEIIQFLNNRGFSVPGEITVIGIGGYLQEICLGENLSTVKIPYYKLGESAAKILLGAIKNPKTKAKTESFRPDFPKEDKHS